MWIEETFCLVPQGVFFLFTIFCNLRDRRGSVNTFSVFEDWNKHFTHGISAACKLCFLPCLQRVKEKKILTFVKCFISEADQISFDLACGFFVSLVCLVFSFVGVFFFFVCFSLQCLVFEIIILVFYSLISTWFFLNCRLFDSINVIKKSHIYYHSFASNYPHYKPQIYTLYRKKCPLRHFFEYVYDLLFQYIHINWLRNMPIHTCFHCHFLIFLKRIGRHS